MTVWSHAQPPIDGVPAPFALRPAHLPSANDAIKVDPSQRLDRLAGAIAGPLNLRPSVGKQSVNGEGHRSPPKIALIIDDLGLSAVLTGQAIEIDAAITLSFLPYGLHTQELAREARRRGKDVMVHLPMEPLGVSNPGPNALFVADTSLELRKKLAWSLSRFDGFVGVNNHMGSKFSTFAGGMSLVLQELSKRNLIYVDSRTGPKATAQNGKIVGYDVLVRDVFLDHSIDEKEIRAQINKTEQIAEERGYAIAIGHPHKLTLDLIAEWCVSAESRGFQFVTVSHLAEQVLEPASEQDTEMAKTTVRSGKNAQIEPLLLPRALALSLY